MPTASRYQDLDALRAIAMIQGVFFHAALSFVDRDVGWAARDAMRSVAVDPLVWASHAFRMHLFFLLAGFFGRLLFERRGLRGFIVDRWRRVGRVFIAGSLLLSPVVMLAWVIGRPVGVEKERTLTRFVEAWVPGHLWFLEYLLLMYAVAIALRLVFTTRTIALPTASIASTTSTASNAELFALTVPRWPTLLDRALERLTTTNKGILFLALLSTAAAYVLSPDPGSESIHGPERSFIPRLDLLVSYGSFFATGWFLHRQPKLRERWGPTAPTRLLIACAMVIGAAAFAENPLGAPWAVSALEACARSLFSWLMVLGLTGLFARHFAQSDFSAPFCRRAYFVYLAHLPIVLFLQRAVETSTVSGTVKYLFVTATTFLLVEAAYRLIRATDASD